MSGRPQGYFTAIVDGVGGGPGNCAFDQVFGRAFGRVSVAWCNVHVVCIESRCTPEVLKGAKVAYPMRNFVRRMSVAGGSQAHALVE